MKVLMLHNCYRQPGGEDTVFQAEARLLRDHGIEVLDVEFDNQVHGESPLPGTVRLALESAWSDSSHAEVSRLCREFRPDVAHIHNFWMRLSPSAHAACQQAGVPVVQTLHNFRLLCVNSNLLRDGRVCEDCLGGGPWRGVLHRCYRDSLVASAVMARMIASSRRRAWDQYVDAFVVLSRHCQAKFNAASLPPERMFVKANFMADPGPPAGRPSASNVMVYAGRLSQEKGVRSLLDGWACGRLSSLGQLLIVGDGEDRAALQRHAASLGLEEPGVTFAGWKTRAEVQSLVASSRAVAVPSICYETSPMSVVEAYAAGRPVVAADHGSMSETVHQGRTGWKFPVAQPGPMAEALREALLDDALADRLGRGARAEYLAHYTPERNFEVLMGIYRFAVERRGKTLPDGAPIAACR